jgi:hypothetical protein
MAFFLEAIKAAAGTAVLFHHHHAQPLPRQVDGRSQAANARANDNLLFCRSSGTPPGLECRQVSFALGSDEASGLAQGGQDQLQDGPFAFALRIGGAQPVPFFFDQVQHQFKTADIGITGQATTAVFDPRQVIFYRRRNNDALPAPVPVPRRGKPRAAPRWGQSRAFPGTRGGCCSSQRPCPPPRRAACG